MVARKDLLSLRGIFVGVLAIVVFTISSCAMRSGPRNLAEAFPLRNQDPRWGIIINEGTTHLNLYIYDQAGRLVEQVWLAGVNRYLTINGQNMPNYWVRRLDYGWYRIEVFPFYYQTDITNIFVGMPVRYRIDLPKFTTGLWVDHNPTDYYDYGYYGLGGTYRHWGWILRLHGGNIPDTGPYSLPGARINIWGNFGRNYPR